MIRSIARAGVMAAALVGSAGFALAADLDYSTKDSNLEPYAPYYYHRDQPRQGQYEERRTEERRYVEPRVVEPPPYVDRYGYRDSGPPSRFSRYDETAPPRDGSRYDQRGCLSQGEIRYRLKEHGWNEFQDVEFRGDTAAVNARRPDGMQYRLEVDRCSGVIVNARLLDDGRSWRQGSRNGPSTY